MKLSLGTVQLGLHYGINNTAGVLSDEQAHELLRAAWEAGFRMLDTSPEYGLAEERIGRYLRENPGAFEVVVKYNAANSPEVFDAVRRRSMERIGKIDHVMLYTTGQDVAALDASVADGVSVYDVAEADAAGAFKLVQVPGSCLDGRMDIVVKGLQRRGQTVLMRSLLLQGLLAADPGAGPGGNTGNGIIAQIARFWLDELHEEAACYAMTVPELAVRWAWEIGPDVAIIGCETPEQAREVGRWWNEGPLPRGIVHYTRRLREDIPELVISPRMWGQVYEFTPATA